MNVLFKLVTVSFATFLATNIDAMVALIFFYSQINQDFRPRHIILGQYLGFSLILLLSLPGFFGGSILSKSWTGLLGLIPIFFGLRALLTAEQDEDDVNAEPVLPFFKRGIFRYFNPHILNVMSVTIANGSDNISAYLPLFASLTLERLLIVIATFYLLLGLWCILAYALTRHPKVADVISRYGYRLTPFLYISLGIYILVENYFL